jgi:ABC-type glycerol-3-phosphate transport system permease component
LIRKSRLGEFIRNRGAWGIQGFTLGIALVVIFPYFWMAVTSFKPLEEFFTYPLRWFSEKYTVEHYRAILGDPRFLKALGNSLAVSIAVTGLSLVVSVPAGYGLTKLRLPGSRPILLTVLSSQFLPPMIFFVPFYIYLSKFQLLNTLSGLILCYLSITLPICTWMVAAFIKQIPSDFEEAARIEGAGEWQILRRIVLPLAVHGIITAGVFAFIQAWQEYIFALLYTSTPKAQTAPVMLFYFLGQHQIDYGRLMSASVLLSLPIMVPFAFVQRYFQQGLTSGGIKG